MWATQTAEKDGSIWFTLDFCPDASLVGVVRRFVDDFCKSLLTIDERGLLAMATHELLENGVKYACDGRVNLRISVAYGETATKVRVGTRNCVSPKDREAVVELFEQRARAAGVADFYRDTMANPRHGGLGLARIMAEAEMDLSYAVESDQLSIVGSALFAKKGA